MRVQGNEPGSMPQMRPAALSAAESAMRSQCASEATALILKSLEGDFGADSGRVSDADGDACEPAHAGPRSAARISLNVVGAAEAAGFGDDGAAVRIAALHHAPRNTRRELALEDKRVGIESLNGEQRSFAAGKDECLGSGGTECGANARRQRRNENLQTQDADIVAVIGTEVFELEFGDGMRGSSDEQRSLACGTSASIARVGISPASACANPAEPA